MSTTFFTSQRNSMKRSPLSGTASMAAPSVSAYSGGRKTTTLTISHNLGYFPVFRIAYEPFKDGIVWPPLSGKSSGNAQNPLNTSITGPAIVAWPSDVNTLTIQLLSDTFFADFTGSFTVYWVIYRDFVL